MPRIGGRATALVVLFALATLATGHFILNQVDAYSASPTVLTGSPTNRFTPNMITINAGDTVTFNWSAGTHVVDLMDVSPDLPIDSAHATGITAAFTKAGTYYFYCSIHASGDQATEAHVQAKDAMVGKIVVSAAATTTATVAPATPTRTVTPAPTAPPVIVPATPPPTQNPPAPAAPVTGTGPTGGDESRPLAPFVLFTTLLLFGSGTGATIIVRRRG